MSFAELQDLIRRALHHGDHLDEVKEEIIDPAPLAEEQKAALWLYAREDRKATEAEAPPDTHATSV
jgi:hypothetical protein